MCDMVRIGTDECAFACLNPLSTNSEGDSVEKGEGTSTTFEVTDVGYFILFLAVACGMLWLDSQAKSLGNVLRLSEPIDYQGRLCGYDEARSLGGCELSAVQICKFLILGRDAVR